MILYERIKRDSVERITMGHREDLLAGAKQCLIEKGYAGTTTRDVVAASGTNLGSISYHFGTKEALLDAALVEAVAEMNDHLFDVTTGLREAGDLTGAWQKMADLSADFRPLLVAMVEAWARAERSPELRTKLADYYESERVRALDEAIPGADARVTDGAERRAVASAGLALSDGWILQWLIDPQRAPDATELATGLRLLADLLDG